MPENNPRFQLSENTWLALVPLVATYLVFLFQSSYFSYFGVPVSMVEVDVPKIIFAMVALALAAILFVVLFSAAADLLRSQNPIVQIIGKGFIGVVVFLPFVLAAAGAFTRLQLMTYGGLFLGLWLMNFWPPAQKPGEPRSYMERLKIQEDTYSDAIKSEPRNIKQAVGTHVLGPFSLIFFLSIYVLMLGTYCASLFGGSTYLKDNPNALYVGRSHDAYIFTLVDPKTNTFGSEILVVRGEEKVALVRSDRRARRRNGG